MAVNATRILVDPGRLSLAGFDPRLSLFSINAVRRLRRGVRGVSMVIAQEQFGSSAQQPARGSLLHRQRIGAGTCQTC